MAFLVKPAPSVRDLPFEAWQALRHQGLGLSQDERDRYTAQLHTVKRSHWRRHRIPTPQTSRALEFIGFDFVASHKIVMYYKIRHNTRHDDPIDPTSFQDYLFTHIDRLLTDPRVKDLEPKKAMAKLGVCPELQNVFVNPEFEGVKWTKTPLTWVVEALKGNYRSLLEVNGSLRRRFGSEVRDDVKLLRMLGIW